MKVVPGTEHNTSSTNGSRDGAPAGPALFTGIAKTRNSIYQSSKTAALLSTFSSQLRATHSGENHILPDR